MPAVGRDNKFPFASGLDVFQQGFVADVVVNSWLAWLFCVPTPPVLQVAAAAYTQHFAGQRDRSNLLMFCNPGIPHGSSRATYAVAFMNNPHLKARVGGRDGQFATRAERLAIVGLSLF